MATVIYGGSEPLAAQLTDIAGMAPTKGNVIVGNGTNFISLGIGANGQALVADSAAATGVAWKYSPYILQQSGARVSTPASTSRLVAATVNIPANIAGTRGHLRLFGYLAKAAGSATVSLYVRSNGVDWGVAQIGGASADVNPFEVFISRVNDGANAAASHFSYRAALGNTGIRAFDYSVDQVITLELQTTNDGVPSYLEYYCLQVFPSAP